MHLKSRQNFQRRIYGVRSADKLPLTSLATSISSSKIEQSLAAASSTDDDERRFHMNYPQSSLHVRKSCSTNSIARSPDTIGFNNNNGCLTRRTSSVERRKRRGQRSRENVFAREFFADSNQHNSSDDEMDQQRPFERPSYREYLRLKRQRSKDRKVNAANDEFVNIGANRLSDIDRQGFMQIENNNNSPSRTVRRPPALPQWVKIPSDSSLGDSSLQQQPSPTKSNVHWQVNKIPADKIGSHENMSTIRLSPAPTGDNKQTLMNGSLHQSMPAQLYHPTTINKHQRTPPSPRWLRHQPQQHQFGNSTSTYIPSQSLLTQSLYANQLTPAVNQVYRSPSSDLSLLRHPVQNVINQSLRTTATPGSGSTKSYTSLTTDLLKYPTVISNNLNTPRNRTSMSLMALKNGISDEPIYVRPDQVRTHEPLHATVVSGPVKLAQVDTSSPNQQKLADNNANPRFSTTYFPSSQRFESNLAASTPHLNGTSNLVPNSKSSSSSLMPTAMQPYLVNSGSTSSISNSTDSNLRSPQLNRRAPSLKVASQTNFPFAVGFGQKVSDSGENKNAEPPKISKLDSNQLTSSSTRSPTLQQQVVSTKVPRLEKGVTFPIDVADEGNLGRWKARKTSLDSVKKHPGQNEMPTVNPTLTQIPESTFVNVLRRHKTGDTISSGGEDFRTPTLKPSKEMMYLNSPISKRPPASRSSENLEIPIAGSSKSSQNRSSLEIPYQTKLSGSDISLNDLKEDRKGPKILSSLKLMQTEGDNSNQLNILHNGFQSNIKDTGPHKLNIVVNDVDVHQQPITNWQQSPLIVSITPEGTSLTSRMTKLSCDTNAKEQQTGWSGGVSSSNKKQAIAAAAAAETTFTDTAYPAVPSEKKSGNESDSVTVLPHYHSDSAAADSSAKNKPIKNKLATTASSSDGVSACTAVTASSDHSDEPMMLAKRIASIEKAIDDQYSGGNVVPMAAIKPWSVSPGKLHSPAVFGASVDNAVDYMNYDQELQHQALNHDAKIIKQKSLDVVANVPAKDRPSVMGTWSTRFHPTSPENKVYKQNPISNIAFREDVDDVKNVTNKAHIFETYIQQEDGEKHKYLPRKPNSENRQSGIRRALTIQVPVQHDERHALSDGSVDATTVHRPARHPAQTNSADNNNNNLKNVLVASIVPEKRRSNGEGHYDNLPLTGIRRQQVVFRNDIAVSDPIVIQKNNRRDEFVSVAPERNNFDQEVPDKNERNSLSFKPVEFHSAPPKFDPSGHNEMALLKPFAISGTSQQVNGSPSKIKKPHLVKQSNNATQQHQPVVAAVRGRPLTDVVFRNTDENIQHAANRDNKQFPDDFSSARRLSADSLASDHWVPPAKVNVKLNSTDAKEDEYTKLSLMEKMKYFERKLNEKPPAPAIHKGPVRRKRLRGDRHQTQPITPDEVAVAREYWSAGVNHDHSTDHLHLADKESGVIAKRQQQQIAAEKGIEERQQQQQQPIPSGINGNAVVSSTSAAAQQQPRKRVSLHTVDECSGEKIYHKPTAHPSVPHWVRPAPPIDPELTVGEEFQLEVERRREAKVLSVISDDEDSGNHRANLNSTNKSHHRRRFKNQPAPGGTVGRSFTQPISPEEVKLAMILSEQGGSIADRLAALKRNGDEEWKQRIKEQKEADIKNEVQFRSKGSSNLAPTPRVPQQTANFPDENRKSIADRLSQLFNAQANWQKRVENKDSEALTVASKLEKAGLITPVVNLSMIHQNKSNLSKLQPAVLDVTKGSTKPEVGRIDRLTNSSEEGDEFDPDTLARARKGISFIRVDPVTFKGPNVASMGSSITSPLKSASNMTDLKSRSGNLQYNDDSAFDAVAEQQGEKLVINKGVIGPRRKSKGSANPLKVLLRRSDIRTEYTENRRSAPSIADNQFAAESIAGLRSTEDFSAVKLRKCDLSSTPGAHPNERPYSDLMLIQIKGRKNVQCRLVQPLATSLNNGDCFLLVTQRDVFVYIGQFSNILEKAKANDFAAAVILNHDLGCLEAKKPVIIDGEYHSLSFNSISEPQKRFWDLLHGSPDLVRVCCDINEDEIYESKVATTNAVYRLQAGGDLEPVSDCYGQTLHYSLLKPDELFVFDFGVEMYVWHGKNASFEQRRLAYNLARNLWNRNINWFEFDLIEKSNNNKEELRSNQVRPSWAIFGKQNQNMETILFKGKFIDWPESVSGVSSARKHLERDSKMSPTFLSNSLQPLLADELATPRTEHNLIIENASVGRGRTVYDPDDPKRSHFEVITTNVKVWHIGVNGPEKLAEKSYGQFYDAETYVIRWDYIIAASGTRTLDGKVSKHALAGRDRCCYFFWHGSNASVIDQCSAALNTIDMDVEGMPHVRVEQNQEPPAFLSLFRGAMIIHKGKINASPIGPHLYLVNGDYEIEAHLLEIDCTPSNLRSQSSYLLFDRAVNVLYVWHGIYSQQYWRRLAVNFARDLIEVRPEEMCFKSGLSTRLVALHEESESPEFLQVIGATKDSKSLKGCYPRIQPCLIENSSKETLFSTARLWHLNAISGKFQAVDLQTMVYREDFYSPFPFRQLILYETSQPACFLLDSGIGRVYLWVGWMPPDDVQDSASLDYADEISSKPNRVRFAFTLRNAVLTTQNYCRAKSVNNGLLVWAGLEPDEFKALFPWWFDRQDVAQLNQQEGHIAKNDSLADLEEEILRHQYSLEILTRKPLPCTVDPTSLETYLSDQDFEKVFRMSKDDFQRLPLWKRDRLKQTVGIF